MVAPGAGEHDLVEGERLVVDRQPFAEGARVADELIAEHEMLVGALQSRLEVAHVVQQRGPAQFAEQGSYEHLVLGDELVGYARAFGERLPVDDEALALDEIMLAGPGGHHLARPMTRRRYRDFRQSTLLDQSVYERWQADGATTLMQPVRATNTNVTRPERSPDLQT